MSPRSSRSPYFVAFAFLVVLLTPRAAEAKKGIPFLFIINTGDAIYRVADLPEELAGDPELEGWALGYKCSHFGLLWADIAAWDKQLVVFKDNTYSDLPDDLRASLEEEHPWSQTERGLWKRFGILIMVGGVAAATMLKRAAS